VTPRKLPVSPYAYPIFYFAVVIVAGATLLSLDQSLNASGIRPIDAVFTATSATCVTGLIVVDTGSYFTPFGQAVILVLIQMGGLGIMTFTSLIFYLWRQRISLNNRVAVGQSLLHDPNFKLGRLLVRIVIFTLTAEIAGATLIHLMAPQGFPAPVALFHAVSAFCNAGFSLFADSLSHWRSHTGINLVFMALIIIGGLGFSVLAELEHWTVTRLKNLGRRRPRPQRLSWSAGVVVRMTLLLIILGAVVLFIDEWVGGRQQQSMHTRLLAALFQSVTCRTAGFNTVPIAQLTNVSLLAMIFLMFVGGAPGSCAGGIKVTTLRTLWAFIVTHFRGTEQVEIGRYAVDRETLNRALMLVVFSSAIVSLAVLVLNVSEGGQVPHPQARGLSLEIAFEAVSAFATVGLSMGLTPNLSDFGKSVIIVLMFVGRLGPVLFLAALQGFQRKRAYDKPEQRLMIG
jgi:trk system potassium uptake protein TrkH